MNKSICKICDGDLEKSIKNLFSIKTITSDCRPWQEGRSVAICKKCGLASRTINTQSKGAFDNIYENYTMFDQSSTTSDQMNFSENGSSLGRTSKILNFVNNIVNFTPENILDFGSGNGAGLLALSEIYNSSNVFGFEPNDKPLSKISTWPKNIKNVFNKRPSEDSNFDLITLFHVFEHIEDIFEVISYIKKILKKNGILIIQVPYLINGPFDIIVADHIHHFTKSSFSYFLKKAELSPLLIDNCVISKELTVVIKNNINFNDLGNDNIEYQLMKNAADWLLNFSKLVNDFKLNNDEIAVFGTGPAAAWTASILGKQCKVYLDEDTMRVGSLFNGKLIVNPNKFSKSIPVIAPFPDYQLNWIKNRFINLKFLN